MAPPIKHGPNIVATSEQVKKRNDALKNLSDDQIKKCEQLLLEGGNSLTALVVGESGTGKSTFINTFLGKEIAKVASGPTEVTRKVKCYTGCVGSIDATVVEVPELDIDEILEHRKELRRYCPNGVDVVFVCQKMYDRHRPSAIETLCRLSIPFSRDIHKKAVFVMTFANEIPKSWGHRTDKKTLQEKLEKDWCDQAAAIREGLVKELNISREEAEEISVLPAGYYDEDDPESQQILGVTSDWISDLKLTAANASKTRKEAEENPRQILGVTSDWISDLRLAAANASQTAIPAILKIMASLLNTNSSSDDRDSSSGSEESSGGYEYSSGGHSSSGGHGSSGGYEYSSGGHSSSGGFGSSGGSEDSNGGFFGLMSKYIQYFAACVKNVAVAVFDKIYSLLTKVASTVFNAVKGIVDAVQKAFTSIYESGALTGVLAGVAVSGAVAAAVVGGVAGILIGAVVIITLSVVLIRLFGYLAGLFVFMGATGGFIAGGIGGAGIGALVGGILGSIIPGAGTAAGAAAGAEIGAHIGGFVGSVCGGAAVSKAVTRK